MAYKCIYEKMQTHIVDEKSNWCVVTCSGPYHWKTAEAQCKAMNYAFQRGVKYAMQELNAQIKEML